MKTIKRTVALALALIMTFAMSVTAFADDAKTYSIKIENAVAGHTYEAYQILAGNLDSTQTKLTNVKWGAGISDDGQAALGNAADYAEDLGNIADKSDEAKAEAEKLNGYLGNPTGTVSVPKESENVDYTINGLPEGYYLVKDKDNTLAGTDDSYTSYILMLVKNQTVKPKSSTTSVVKKVQDTNDTTGDTTGWQDSADYDIGDNVPFELTATLADNVSTYKKYKLIFHDTLSEGLTYNEDYKVTIDGKDVTKDFTQSYEGTKLTFSCDDVKAIGATSNSIVIVDYSAKLNENAIIGEAGNPNDVYLEFSNNPNSNGDGDNDDKTGNTPKDTVIVFTYKVVINKVDAEGKSLEGAGFTLFKKLKNGKEVEISYVEINDDKTTVFTFKGLDDGDYILRETKTPDGYNTITDQEFTVKAEHDIDSSDPKLTSLTGDVTTGTIEFSKSLEEGSLNADVVNQSGSVLPSTGGAGRVAIYVIGAILVIGGGIVLVTKRRVR